MKITSKLQNTFVECSQNRDKVEVHFIDGYRVIGFVSNIDEGDSMQVEIMKFEYLPEEDSSIWLDFDEIDKIIITKKNGQSQYFE